MVDAMEAMNAELKREREELMRQQQMQGQTVNNSLTSMTNETAPAASTEDDGSNEDLKAGGLRALWRKSRLGFLEQQRNRHKVKQDEMESASAAAAVARFIMEKQKGAAAAAAGGNAQPLKEIPAEAPPPEVPEIPLEKVESGGFKKNTKAYRKSLSEDTGWIASSSGSDESVETDDSSEEEQHDDDDDEEFFQQKEHDSHSSHPTQTSLPEEKQNQMTEDVRLATLLLPLSKLPFNDGNESAAVSQWYSMDTIGSNTPTNASSAGNMSSSTSQVVMSHKRNPSLLLEISFSTGKQLDDSEDEVDADDGASDLMWGKEDDAANPSCHQEAKDGSVTNTVSTIDTELTASTSAKPNITKTPSQKQRKNTEKTSRRASFKAAAQEAISKEQQKKSAKKKEQDDNTPKEPAEPVLNAGVVDYCAIVGARDIGNQRNDDGSKGWVESNPECVVLERWPKDDDFHYKNGRETAVLPNKVEWFCFPEGTKLWRGTDPPTHFDLKPRGGASTPSASIAAFDACLKCATSFSWFVISSTGESYGSKNVKTHGAVIRFFVPAPYAIDPTQDDYAQFDYVTQPSKAEDGNDGNAASSANTGPSRYLKRKRLWVPLGICLTSSLPIIGILEAMLLRLCEQLALHRHKSIMMKHIYREIAECVLNYQTPIPGVLHCSIPFLIGERLHLTNAPPTGLPALPHGACVTNVCRLLGAEGLTTLLAAVLTECKILIHSSDIANLAMVAEVVVGGLIYPFHWALPYIPVLPESMLEFVEAPLSYFLGVPTCVMKWLDKSVLRDIVVFDLDHSSSPDYFDGSRREDITTKRPTPLPASMSSNITKAVFRLLREEEEVEEQYYSRQSFSHAGRHLPRLEAESLAEREFRISVSRQVCGLMRGYQECLFFVSSNQPVFNRDRFLRNAPALFEQRRGSVGPSMGPGPQRPGTSRVLSPRAKRFLSLMVNTQHFHQLLERLDYEDTAFFHEVMDTYDATEEVEVDGQTVSEGLSNEDAITQLSEALQKMEDKIPTYRVDRYHSKKNQKGNDGENLESAPWEDETFGGLAAFDEDEEEVGTVERNFTHDMLGPIYACNEGDASSVASGADSNTGVKSLSVEVLVELEKNPWKYCRIVDVNKLADDRNFAEDILTPRRKVTVKEAIGERRYRVYKMMLQQREFKQEDSFGRFDTYEEPNNIDLNSLLSSVNDNDLNSHDPSESAFPTETPMQLTSLTKQTDKSIEQQKMQDSNDRDVVRRCLERAYEGAQHRPTGGRFTRRNSVGHGESAGLNFQENGRDLIQEAEAALRNPSAQRFLVTVLSKRARLEHQRRRRQGSDSSDVIKPGQTNTNKKDRGGGSVSRLVPAAFECLVRLCCAMLEACLEEQDYESAYRLLTHTAGFCTIKPSSGANANNGQVADDSFRSLSMRSMGEIDATNRDGQIIYMTARIGMHPIFADLRLWERVLYVHQQERRNSGADGAGGGGSSSGRSTPTGGTNAVSAGETSNTGENTATHQKDSQEVIEYEAAVSTLYEMLAYGVPAEELARFATRVSEARGWFSTDKGQSLLVLARRLTVRRDDGNDNDASSVTGIEAARTSSASVGSYSEYAQSSTHTQFGDDTSILAEAKANVDISGSGGMFMAKHDRAQMEWEELAWSHPTGTRGPAHHGHNSLSSSSSSINTSHPTSSQRSSGDMTNRSRLSGSRRSSGTLSILQGMLGGTNSTNDHTQDPRAQRSVNLLHKENPYTSTAQPDYGLLSSQEPITNNFPIHDDVLDPRGYQGRSAITSLASFGASVVATGGLDGSVFLAHTIQFPQLNGSSTAEVRGVRVECGKDNGAVTCLAAARGAGYKQTTQSAALLEDEEFLSALEGCRVVAGTTGGALRVWSVKDIYASTRGAAMAGSGDHDGGSADARLSEKEGQYIRSGQQSMANKLKWSLKGRALSGHRGGVTCVDVPSPIYRPDSLVSGGADGAIKLWSLRHSNRRSANKLAKIDPTSSTSRIFGRASESGTSAGDAKNVKSHANDAQATLAGHSGRVLCVRTAWHGDRLLSGGADRTVRLWDLSGSGGKCLQTLNGHSCWVTHANYWGPHTIVSASTDRSIALWDVRTGAIPLFVLRYHRSSVSDLLLGSRMEPLMVSAGGDGTIATWDFRTLSSAKDDKPNTKSTIQTVRQPVVTMQHCLDKNSNRCSGAILLSRGVGLHERSVLSASIDGQSKEWDIASGKLLGDQPTGHSDAVSCLSTFAESEGLRRGKRGDIGRVSSVGGTITCSWDGTVRVRRLLLKSSSVPPLV